MAIHPGPAAPPPVGLVTGVHYPSDESEFARFFPNEDKCRLYLERLRWPDGFVCPACGHQAPKLLKNSANNFRCPHCRVQTSVTSGTLLEGTRLPLRLWVRGAWDLAVSKAGHSALSFQQELGIGSYETAWLLFHKLRRAMIDPNRSKLTGTVEIDKCFVGGLEKGRRGRGAEKKALVIIAVELGPVTHPKYKVRKIQRIRLSRILSASSADIVPWVIENVELGSDVIADDNAVYAELARPWPDDPHGPPRYRVTLKNMAAWHAARRAAGADPPNPLPHVHRVISLFKRWLLGTHQGAVPKRNLDHYLEEFTFRFNRKTSKSRGLIFYRLLKRAMTMPPVPMDLVQRSVKPMDVVDILDRLLVAGLHPVLTGGWAVDACLGRQTRVRSDIDILISAEELLRAYVALHGRRSPRRRPHRAASHAPLPTKAGVFDVVPARQPCSIRLEDDICRPVDLIPILQTPSGEWIERLDMDDETRVFTYSLADLQHLGHLYGREIVCVAPAAQELRRSGLTTKVERKAIERIVPLAMKPSYGLKTARVVRKATSAIRRRPEDELDLVQLREPVAGGAVPPPDHVFTPDELDHIAGDEVPERQIVDLADFDPETDLDEDV